MREISSPLDGFASPFGPQRGFNPLRIFANDEPGVWFEANDSTTLFTDVAGTTPVTAPGDAVALQLDKSQGLQLGPELVADNPYTVDNDLQTVATIAANTAYEVDFTVSDFAGSGLVGVESGTFDNAGLSVRRLSGNGSSKFIGITGDSPADVRINTTSTATAVINVSVKELPGNHRTQATVAARPLYALHPVGGVRNLLEYTEEFDNAVWSKFGTAALSVDATGPNGDLSATTLLDSNAGGSGAVAISTNVTVSTSTEYTFSLYAKADQLSWIDLRSFNFTGGDGETYFDLSSGAVGTSAAAHTASILDVGNGWYRCSITFTTDAADTSGTIFIYAAEANNDRTLDLDGTSSILIYGAQLEEGSTATNYQRVGSFLDVSEEGKARRGRLWYNGTSHFMETGTITPGTDKVQVFAGVRKLSDNPQNMLMEFSESIATNDGCFHITQFSGTQFFRSKGTSQASANPGGFNPPVSLVMTGLGDISGDSAILRIDGVQEAISTADQGTGNYLAYPLYFGARAGTSLFYNGYEDTSIVRFGPNLDATTISKVESYVASKTPEPTL